MSTILHKEAKGREGRGRKLTFFNVPGATAVGLNPPHVSFLLILSKIQKVSPEKSHSRDR